MPFVHIRPKSVKTLKTYLHENKYFGSTMFSSDYLVMIANDLGNAIGRGTDYDFDDPSAIPPNSLALDANDVTSGSTLAHEIGHACFKLFHPDNDPEFKPVCDNNNFMFFTAENPTNSNLPCKGKRTNNIRAYHFDKIHKIR